MLRLAKWLFWSQTVLGLSWGGFVGLTVITLPRACKTQVYGARSAEGLLSALNGCPEAQGLVNILSFLG